MSLSRDVAGGWGRVWVVRTPYNGLYGMAPPEKGTFFSFSYMEGVEISFVKVYKRVAKSVFFCSGSYLQKDQKGLTGTLYVSGFVIYSY